MSAEAEAPKKIKNQLAENPSDDEEEDTNEELNPNHGGDTPGRANSDANTPSPRSPRSDSKTTAGNLTANVDAAAKVRRESSSGHKSPAAKSSSSAFTRMVRKLVSKKKNRLQEAGYDLDMTYITDRIIAMGYPTEDASFQSSYRNPFSEVYGYLEEFHKDHYKVYNLCSERKYDHEKFHGRVAEYPFDDHNCPRFSMILEFCEDAKQWLDADEANIIAVHCKAGKGRTGLMISSYLVYGLDFESAGAALEFYGNQRTSNGKGVTLPSQIRYVEYFYKYLNEYHRVGKAFPVAGVPVRFRNVILSSIPHFDPDKGSDPYIIAYLSNGKQIYDSRDFQKPNHFVPNKKNPIVELSLNHFPVVKGDVDFVMYDYDPLGGDDKMCYFWVHTSFLPESTIYEMAKPTIDVAHKDKKSKHFDKHWTVSLTYTFEDPSAEALSGEEQKS
jgi:phosphatidylinositol-3,4,5-trisphosphate 3-phosphatase/dual-specificity protein phosphatase PTEN